MWLADGRQVGHDRKNQGDRIFLMPDKIRPIALDRPKSPIYRRRYQELIFSSITRRESPDRPSGIGRSSSVFRGKRFSVPPIIFANHPRRRDFADVSGMP